ncbi:hypothetical protein K432DRAFT_248738, partial [Lepidopterella palustris CBS 459.81]
MASPIPVILCGQHTAVAERIIAGLLPEYEVIHFILSPSAGASEIPSILAGTFPPTITNLGTQNHSKPPAAIITGSPLYDDAGIAEMRDACKDSAVKVPWLRLDKSKPGPPPGPGKEYGEALVARIKVCLRE